MAVEIFIFAAVLFGVLGGLMLERFRVLHEEAAAGEHGGGRALALVKPGGGGQLPVLFRSPTAALQQVTDSRFSARRLIDSNEEQIFDALESIVRELDLDWRVMAQVNLADIVESADPDALAAIGDQRVALLIVSAAQMPLAAVEYQGLGQVRDESTLRAAIRREALRRADVEYIEVRSNDTPDILREQVRRLAARVTAVGSIKPIIAASVKPAPAGKPAARPATARKPRAKPAGA